MENQLYKNPCESCLEAGLKKGNTGRSLSEAEAVNQETKEMFAELGKENERITAHPDQTVTYEKQMDSYDVFKTIEKNRSRMEYRTMQICHNTDLITLCKKQKEIKTVGWLEQIRIPMEKDKDGKDITPAYEDFIKNGTVRRPRITTGDDLTDDKSEAKRS